MAGISGRQPPREVKPVRRSSWPEENLPMYRKGKYIQARESPNCTRVIWYNQGLGLLIVPKQWVQSKACEQRKHEERSERLETIVRKGQVHFAGSLGKHNQEFTPTAVDALSKNQVNSNNKNTNVRTSFAEGASLPGPYIRFIFAEFTSSSSTTTGNGRESNATHHVERSTFFKGSAVQGARLVRCPLHVAPARYVRVHRRLAIYPG